MEDHAVSGTQAAALLRPQPGEGRRRRDKESATQDQRGHDPRTHDPRDSRDSRRGRPSALTVHHDVPVVHTDQFRVVEPDGTEDPGASADDGLAPGKPD